MFHYQYQIIDKLIKDSREYRPLIQMIRQQAKQMTHLRNKKSYGKVAEDINGYAWDIYRGPHQGYRDRRTS